MPITVYNNIAPVTDKAAFVAPSADIIGDVTLGEDSSIWYGCVLRGDVNDIKVGRGTNIQDGSVVHVATHGQGAYIGDEVTIGHMALIHACAIEDRAFIGMKACVMDDVVVEKGAMVAAGALITPGKRVPSGQLWAGTPAKYIRDLTEDDYKMFRWSWTHYVDLAKSHRDMLSGSDTPL